MRGASPDVVIAGLVVTGLVSVVVALRVGRFADDRQRREEEAIDRLRERDLAHARRLVDLAELRATADESIRQALKALEALDVAIVEPDNGEVSDEVAARIQAHAGP